MRKTGLIIILLHICICAMQAQTHHRNCGSMDALNNMLQANPAIATARQEIEDQTQRYAAQNIGSASRSAFSVTIPVVVHIVYNNAIQNITDAQIQSQIAILNQDYTQTNSDWSGTPAVFQTVSGSPGIHFCLAQRDPNGNATTGIVRKSTVISPFTTNDNVKQTALGGDDAWPASSYLNIWVCDLGTSLLGYAQFPGGSATTDGVVIHYTAFGNTGTALAPYDQGRTATHEIGHWLNLYHIWGDDNGACTGTDHVDDTPNQAGENFGCPLFPHISCTNGPNGDMFMNFMDYTDDACMSMFSAGQSTRVQSIFAAGGVRASLTTSSGCSAPGGSIAACGIPTGLTTGTIASPTDTIYWTAVSGATSYILSYKPTAASVWATITATSSAKALTALNPSTTYNYKIQAVCSSSSSNYSSIKSFTTTQSLASCTDIYETNETRSTAKPINVNTDIYAQIGTANDRDYFKFNNTAVQPNIKISLTALPADYDLRLYSADGTLLFTSQNNGTAAETIFYNNAPVATYYVNVAGSNNAYNSTDCYTLNASLSNTPWKESSATGIDDIKAETQYNVYSNPNNGKFHLMISSSTMLPKVSVKVTDMVGKTIHTEEYENIEGLYSFEINLSNTPTGIYNVIISDGQNTETRKILVQK